MPSRRALFIDAQRLTAYRWQSGELCREGQFASDILGLESFAQYLVRQRQSHFYLLAEVVDEAYRQDDIPFVRGRDRQALLTRKLGQYFTGTALSLVLSLGRESSGRRDEKMLFAALTRPQHLEPWLAALRGNEAQLVGIYSLPLLAGVLVPERATMSGPALVVTLTSGGLRQTFFINGGLRFSRLLPLPSANLEQCAITCAGEAARSYHYLVGQRLIARGTPLTTRVLAHPEDIAGFRSQCFDCAELRFEFIDLLTESRKHGLKTLPYDSHSEALFLHLMVSKPPSVQFSPQRDRRYFQLWRGRFMLNAGGIMILLGCLLFAGKQVYECQQLDSEIGKIRMQNDNDRQGYAATLKALPPLPTSIDRLVSLIARYDDLEIHSATLEPMLSRISKALQGFPGIQINRIDWRNGVSVEESMGPTGRVRPALIADLYIHLPEGLASDHRTQLRAIQSFSTVLGKDGAADVSILRMPFDMASDKSLNNSPSHGDSMEYLLRIVEKQ